MRSAPPIQRMLWRIRRRGLATGCRRRAGAILCPNHISFLDSAFLMLTVPRNISFVGKAEYMDSWKTKYLFPALGMIPIDRVRRRRERARRSTRRPSVLRPRRAVRHLPRGHAQPRRHAAQGPHRRRPAGADASAARSSRSASSAPARSSRPTPRCRSRSGRARSRIGRPIDVERYRDRADDRTGAAPDHRRGDVRDPRADRPGVRRRVRRPRRPRRMPTDVGDGRRRRRRGSPTPERRRVGRSADG